MKRLAQSLAALAYAHRDVIGTVLAYVGIMMLRAHIDDQVTRADEISEKLDRLQQRQAAEAQIRAVQREPSAAQEAAAEVPLDPADQHL